MPQSDPILEELQIVRALLARRKGWVQNVQARDRDGHQVDAWNPVAQCFCLMGASIAAAYRHHQVVPDRSRNNYIVDADIAEIVKALGFGDSFQVVDWNDVYERRKKDVLARVDAAITTRLAA